MKRTKAHISRILFIKITKKKMNKKAKEISFFSLKM